MKRAFATTLLAFALASCSRGEVRPGVTNVTGASPDLAFSMERASDGRAVSQTDYRGKVTVLYFGYTRCPDICPATLANLTDAVGKLGRDGRDVRILFVTVDPDRDTLPALREYAAAFSNQIDGLHGSANELLRLARRFRVAYEVRKTPNYEVMHSESVFFFDREGQARLVELTTDDTTAVANDLRSLLRS